MGKLNPSKLTSLVSLGKPEEKTTAKIDLNTFLKDGLAKPQEVKPVMKSEAEAKSFEFGIDDDSDSQVIKHVHAESVSDDESDPVVEAKNEEPIKDPIAAQKEALKIEEETEKPATTDVNAQFLNELRKGSSVYLEDYCIQRARKTPKNASMLKNVSLLHSDNLSSLQPPKNVS